MKKIIMGFVSILVLILMFPLSCLTILCISQPNLTPPCGVWHNEELNLTLFVDQELSIGGDGIATWRFPGIYVRNGEEISISVNFNEKFGTIWIYENVVLEDGVVVKNTLFYGEYRIENDRIYVGGTRYIFELVEEEIFNMLAYNFTIPLREL